MALDFVPRPGKSPSGYGIAGNFAVTGPTPGQYSDNTPTMASHPLTPFPKSRPAAPKAKRPVRKPTSKQPSALEQADVRRKVP